MLVPEQKLVKKIPLSLWHLQLPSDHILIFDGFHINRALFVGKYTKITSLWARGEFDDRHELSFINKPTKVAILNCNGCPTDAMAAVKLNTFHWHITDSQSFPFVSERRPILTQLGALTPQKVYILTHR